MNRTVLYTCVAIAGLLLFANQVFAANFVRSASSNANVLLDSADNWTTIRQVSVTIAEADDNPHGCVVTASADVDNPGPATVENQYRFVVTRNNDNPTTNTGPERLLELVDNSGVNDPTSKPVATTAAFLGLTNANGEGGTATHVFRFLGRKVAGTDSDTTVLDASLAVICVHSN